MSTKRKANEAMPITTSSKSKSKSKSNNEEEVMDAPDLELRILRKAETAILGRTSQILIVY
jgi:hypothetical protein